MNDQKSMLSKAGLFAGALLLFALVTIPIYLFMTSGTKKVNASGEEVEAFEKEDTSGMPGYVSGGGTTDVDDFDSTGADAFDSVGADDFGGAGGFNAPNNDKGGYKLSPVRFWIGFAGIFILYIVYFELVLKKQFYYFMKENSGRINADEEEGILNSKPNYLSYLAALLPFFLFLVGEAIEITLIPMRITNGTVPFLGLPWEISYVLLAVFVFYTMIMVWIDSNYNHILYFDEEPFCYCRFGHGDKNLVLITGLNMMTLRGKGLQLAYFYRQFMKDYTVYVFDKKDEVPEGVTIEDLSEDIAAAMKCIGLQKADVVGVSQGGMIAQYLALNHPELVDKLVLCVTAARPNETLQKFVNHVIILAKSGEMEKITKESFETEYTMEYRKKIRPFLPILSKVGIPKSNTRFIRLAQACLTGDTYDRLDQIENPVFVIAAGKDKTVSCAGTEEIAEKLGCKKYTYSRYGHFVFSEAKDFNDRILKFLKTKTVKKTEAASEPAEKTQEELVAEFEESLK